MLVASLHKNNSSSSLTRVSDGQELDNERYHKLTLNSVHEVSLKDNRAGLNSVNMI